MPPQEDALLRRPLYVYDLPPEVLSSLALKAGADASDEPETETSIPSESRPQTPESTGTSSTLVGSQACSLCGLSFDGLEEQRSHLKSDWHHCNLKQKLRGLKPVSESEFEKLIGDLDESLSGEDDSSEDEDEQAKGDSTLVTLLKKQANIVDKSRKDKSVEEERETSKNPRGSGTPPLVWFTSPQLPENHYYGIYRAIFTNEELATEDKILDAVKSRQLDPISMPKPLTNKDGTMGPSAATYTGRHIFMCMIGGGHFAAMVVSLAPKKSKSSAPLNREATVLAHKTFHRYTTRRKQGGSQSANDNAKGTAHSAGSSLRRYNEQALVEDVRNLLSDWKGLLDTADLLFVRATGVTNRRTLFGPYEGQVLRANDPRLRGFPFSTKRATQNELMRSFIELTRLKVREILPVVEQPPQPEQKQAPGPKQTPVKKLSEEEETAQLHTQQMQALIRRSKLPSLLTYIKNNNLTPDFRFHPPETQQNHHAPTPLHLAASLNSATVAHGLLVRGGANPTIHNGQGRTAFELAGDRATRDAFRVARAELGEDKWTWGEDGAKVPAALTRAEADQREEREAKKEADRRKAEEERLKREEAASGAKKGGASGARKAGGLLDGTVPKTAQDRREEEMRGLTPEQKMRIERERRARAAEERLKRMQSGS